MSHFQNLNLSLPTEIQSVIKLILVLRHYQESVERGFNITKSVNKVNIGQESVIARKLIIDHIQKKRSSAFKYWTVIISD